MSYRLLSSFVVLVGASIPAVCSAQPRVAIAAAAGTSPTAIQYTDIQTKLQGLDMFAVVDIIHCSNIGGGITPSLEQLQGYDAVLTWSNQTFVDADAMGNVLADYVDSGGGVVVAVFATSTTTVGRSLGGRFRSGGYEIIPTQGGNTGGAANLGTILDPAHPVMNGVNSLIGGTTASRPTSTAVSTHGFKVALWSDGKTLAAASTQYPNRVDLGIYPLSRDGITSGWDPTTDGALLIGNALLATVRPPCDPDLNQDGNADQGDIDYLVNVVGGGENPTGIDPDFNRDGNADQGDVDALLNVVAGAPCSF